MFRQIAFSQLRCPRCLVESVAIWYLFSHGFHDAWWSLSIDRLQLITVTTMHVRNRRQIAFSLFTVITIYVGISCYIAFNSHGFHGAWQNLTVVLVYLGTYATIHATNFRCIAFNQSRCPRCILESIASSPLVRHGVYDACQKLSLYHLQVITLTTIHVRICRQTASSYPGWPRCMLKTVARFALESQGVRDACQNMSPNRLQLYTMATMQDRNCRQIAFSQSWSPRCMLGTVPRSHLISLCGHDACWNLSLNRLYLFTVSTMHGRTCRYIAFIQSRWPRCMLESVARSPLLNYGGQYACQKSSLDRLQLITVTTIHVRNCGQLYLVRQRGNDAR